MFCASCRAGAADAFDSRLDLIGLALTLLNAVLSLSLVSLGSRFQAYGVIGGVLVLTLWVWLVGVILYYGQCLSVELALRLRPRQQGDPNPLLV